MSDDLPDSPEPEYIDGEAADLGDSPTIEQDVVEEFLRIGPLIRSYRRLAGWSQEDLSRESDVQQEMIARIENGFTARPQRATLDRLANAFARKYAHLNADELLQDFEDAKNMKSSRLEASPEAKLISARMKMHTAKFKRLAYEAINRLLDTLEDIAEIGP